MIKQYLNILIVEDSVIFTQGLKLLLKQNSTIKNIHTATTFDESLNILKQESIDIVILDLNFETKEYDGFIIAKKVKEFYPKIKIMILTQHTRINHYERLFNDCKVDAYLDKQLGVDETLNAIKAVMKGNKFIDENIAEMLEIEGWINASKRETDVIELLIKGLTQKEIADELYISPKTVEVHIRNMFRKFKVKNSIELVAKYIKYRNANREGGDNSISPFKKL